MTSSRPYLVRAIYEWLIDNNLTPYIMVDVSKEHVEVPQKFVEDGRIVLNVSPQAVGGLVMNNHSLEFDARFSGIAHHIYVPIPAITAIYAFENGRGMVFNEEDDDGDPPVSPEPSNNGNKGSNESGPRTPPKGKPSLKVVK